MTQEKPKRIPKKLTIETIFPNLRNKPVVLALKSYITTRKNSPSISLKDFPLLISGALLMIYLFFGFISYNLYSFSVTRQTIVFDWLPEVSIGILIVFHFLYGLSIVSNRKALTIVSYRYWSVNLIFLIYLCMSVRLIALEDTVDMLVYFGIMVAYTISLKNSPRKAMQKMENARKRKWLDKNLDEKEWTWVTHVYPELDGPKEAQKLKEKMSFLENLRPLLHGVTIIYMRIFGHADVINFLGFLFYYVSTILVRDLLETSGRLRQLKIWEEEKGKELMLPVYKK